MRIGPPARHAAAALITAAALLCAPLTAALAQEAPAAVASTERQRLNARVFDRVWTVVKRDYYDAGLNGVDWDAARDLHRPRAIAAADDGALYAAINAMLDLLDDAHAQASSPAATRRQDAAGRERPVLGVTLSRGDDGGFTVESIREGSAAEEAGIRPGWRLVTGSGAWTPDQDVRAGEPVKLAFVDETGATRAYDLAPRIMAPLPTFVADRSRPGVLVLKVRAFEPGLGRWMGAELAGLAPEVDVILDFRGNPGGRLYEAEAVLGCFLPAEVPWAWRTARTGARRLMTTSAPCGDLAAPLDNDVAVLVGPGSRSAAELTPAALQESGRGLVVGAQTPGAVLISMDTDLPDGGRLTLSRADFVTVSGVRLEKRGVTPDVVVAVEAGPDAALEAAIAALADHEGAQQAVWLTDDRP